MQKYLLQNKLQTALEPWNDDLVRILKEIVLVRQRDRSIREAAIRALKILFKLNPKLDVIFRKYKFYAFVAFILEREFRNNAVEKERRQCFKFIKAWLFKSPKSFPILFAQVIVGIVRNEEDF